MPARIWFRSVDKYGSRQPAWIFPLSHLLRNQWKNFVETSHMDSSQPLLLTSYYIPTIFIEAADSGKEVGVVFCDISKAFNRVWHKGLLHKL